MSTEVFPLSLWSERVLFSAVVGLTQGGEVGSGYCSVYSEWEFRGRVFLLKRHQCVRQNTVCLCQCVCFVADLQYASIAERTFAFFLYWMNSDKVRFTYDIFV